MCNEACTLVCAVDTHQFSGPAERPDLWRHHLRPSVDVAVSPIRRRGGRHRCEHSRPRRPTGTTCIVVVAAPSRALSTIRMPHRWGASRCRLHSGWPPAGAPRLRDDGAARTARSSWVGGASSRLLQACAGSAVELANSLANTCHIRATTGTHKWAQPVSGGQWPAEPDA